MPTSDSAVSTGRRVTLQDVARFAGVSLATASKALNGRGDVRATTRERVRVAAERLGFEPNGLAKGLSQGRSGTVGMLTSDLVGRFSLPILMGAEDEFGAGEVSVFLCDARGDAIRERHQVGTLLRRQIDGLVVVGSSTDPRPALSVEVPVPVVYAYAPSEDESDTSVVTDNVGAGRQAVDHLLAMGRRRIAHLSGEESYAAARDRASGATAALAAAGLPLVGGHVRYGSWSETWGRVGARLLLAEDHDLDAIVCGNDQIARGAIESLNRAGLQVPDDIAIVGFDNWDVLAADSNPPITSVDLNLQGLGREAARLIRAAIDGRPNPGVHAVEPRLVVRGSSAPAAHH